MFLMNHIVQIQVSYKVVLPGCFWGQRSKIVMYNHLYKLFQITFPISRLPIPLPLTLLITAIPSSGVLSSTYP